MLERYEAQKARIDRIAESLFSQCCVLYGNGLKPEAAVRRSSSGVKNTPPRPVTFMVIMLCISRWPPSCFCCASSPETKKYVV